MEYYFQLASDKIKAMNWEQQKIMHYLIFKNKYVLYKENTDESITDKGGFLLQFYLRIKERMPHLPVQAVKSYAINTCIHLKEERKQLLRKVNFSTAYQLRYNLLLLTDEAKAAIFDTVTTN